MKLQWRRGPIIKIKNWTLRIGTWSYNPSGTMRPNPDARFFKFTCTFWNHGGKRGDFGYGSCGLEFIFQNEAARNMEFTPMRGFPNLIFYTGFGDFGSHYYRRLFGKRMIIIGGKKP